MGGIWGEGGEVEEGNAICLCSLPFLSLSYPAARCFSCERWKEDVAAMSSPA